MIEYKKEIEGFNQLYPYVSDSGFVSRYDWVYLINKMRKNKDPYAKGHLYKVTVLSQQVRKDP